MRAIESLQERMRPLVPTVHAARWSALWRVVSAVGHGERLWLTALGRALPTTAHRKHAIKAVDRLLGNEHLAEERHDIAAAMVSLLIPARSRPVILIDTMEVRHRLVVMTAALACDGRAVPIWSMKVWHYAPTESESRRFLEGLARVLPQGARPILITDGGFREPWLAMVTARGWHYITRIRGNTQCLHQGAWRSVNELHRLALTRRARNLGIVRVSRTSQAQRRMVLSKLPVCLHRQVKTRTGPSRDTNHRVYRANAYEPLLLATSLGCNAEQVVELYKGRMQIEESFRDLKNHRWGWSLRHCRSRAPNRLELLLLIGSLAMVAQLLVGIAGEAAGLHKRHQANTVTKRRVLSLFLLGGLIASSLELALLPQRAFAEALRRMRQAIRTPGLRSG